MPTKTQSAPSKPNPRQELKVSIGPFEWGKLCEAGLVLGCTPEKALETFLTDTGALMNWDPS